MNLRKSVLALTIGVTAVLIVPPAQADWHLESNNSPSGLTAYASTYWINGIGSVDYKGLTYFKVPNDTFFASLMVQCTNKKYIVSMTLLQTGSAHDDLTLDDPGFTKVQFLNSTLNKKATYRTYGTGIEGMLAIGTNAQDFVSNILKARTVNASLTRRNGQAFKAVFDVRDLKLAKTRFVYAGCKM